MRELFHSRFVAEGSGAVVYKFSRKLGVKCDKGSWVLYYSGGMTFYIVSVSLSFIAGLLVALFIINGRVAEALFIFSISFLIVSLNEKTGALEKLIRRRTRRKLRRIGLLLLWFMVMLLVALIVRGVMS